MSGTEYLLDTNMVIGLLKGHGPALALATQAGLKANDTIAVSQISRMELLGFPQLTDAEDSAIRSFLAAGQVHLLNAHIEAQAISLRRSGAFKLPDAIVAATAISLGLRLLTLDKAMVQGMQKLGYIC